ncbi:MAG: hypothetical protein K9L30_02860 [Desulfobacterales bacterium]|nr:hypothetical protein [Desulfobacterales bacterium]
MPNEYQTEQLDTLDIAISYLAGIKKEEKDVLVEQIKPYQDFREDVDDFLVRYCSDICTRKCYENNHSACCSKDGIIIFFADVVINAILSGIEDIEKIRVALKRENNTFKCVFLGKEGCIWKIKPIVCKMFLCDEATDLVFKAHPETVKIWKALRQREKLFKWPDRPVLFDHLEKIFIKAGYDSSLMHLNKSPGLLRVKAKAGMD